MLPTPASSSSTRRTPQATLADRWTGSIRGWARTGPTRSIQSPRQGHHRHAGWQGRRLYLGHRQPRQILRNPLTMTDRPAILLLATPSSYRLAAFVRAASTLDLDVIRGIDTPGAPASRSPDTIYLDFTFPRAAVSKLVGFVRTRPTRSSWRSTMPRSRSPRPSIGACAGVTTCPARMLPAGTRP